MLSVAPVRSAGGAASYFAKDDLYDPGLVKIALNGSFC